MTTRADWDDGTPIYRQIRSIIVLMILDNELPEGDSLPSVRQVAKQFQVNPLTVLKGYQQMAREGLIESRRGRGMFVLPGARERLVASERERFLSYEWPKVIDTLYRLGLDPLQLLPKEGE
jgi:GntR family transcriptional regulator